MDAARARGGPGRRRGCCARSESRRRSCQTTAAIVHNILIYANIINNKMSYCF